MRPLLRSKDASGRGQKKVDVFLFWFETHEAAFHVRLIIFLNAAVVILRPVIALLTILPCTAYCFLCTNASVPLVGVDLPDHKVIVLQAGW